MRLSWAPVRLTESGRIKGSGGGGEKSKTSQAPFVRPAFRVDAFQYGARREGGGLINENSVCASSGCLDLMVVFVCFVCALCVCACLSLPCVL